jgi:CHAD domain-containing protein
MTRRAAALLTRPVPAAVAQVAVALLDQARAAGARLDGGQDPEALHDFRVALRRLRTLLRAYRQDLGDLAPKKVQRRLRELTRATSGGRDAEVQLAWIEAHRGELGKRLRTGVPWLLARLEEREAQAYTAIRGEVVQEFREQERRLRRALNPTLVAPNPRGPAFGAAAARLVREHGTTLDQELAAAQTAHDDESVHAARIAVKRLRYLLEPLAAEMPAAAPAVEQLKHLQDLLGELHDLAVLVRELGDAVAEAAAQRARRLHELALKAGGRGRALRAKRPQAGSAGLLALARLAAEWQDRLFQRLATEWGDAAVATLLGDVAALADALATPPAPVLPLPALPVPPAPHVPPRRARSLVGPSRRTRLVPEEPSTP